MEEWSSREVSSVSWVTATPGYGFVHFDGPFELAYVCNRYCRTIEKVWLEIGSVGVQEAGDASGLVDSELVASWTRGPVLVKADDFVRSLRPGWLTQARKALADAGLSSGGGEPDEERSTLLLSAEGKRVRLLLDTTGTSLSFREYRRYNHPSALRPTFAASMVLMASGSGGRLYDPFTGGGTILIEAALMSRSSPVHASRPYAYRSFTCYDPKAEEASAPRASAIAGFSSYLGCEINRTHLKGCLKNVEAAGLSDVVEACLCDGTRRSLEPRASAIITNPPYGVRGAKRRRMEEMYSRFLHHLPRVLEEDGTGVLITTEFELVKGLLDELGYSVDVSIRARHGHLWVEVIRFSRL